MSLVKTVLMLKSQGCLIVFLHCYYLPSLEPGIWARAHLGRQRSLLCRSVMDTRVKRLCELFLVFAKQFCFDVVYKNVLVLSS